MTEGPYQKQKRLMMSGLRECTKCLITLPIDNFWSAGPYTHSRCKTCATGIQRLRRAIKPDLPSASSRAAAKRWRETHPEEYRNRIESWRVLHPEHGRQAARRRRVRKSGNGIFLITAKDLQRLRLRQLNRCYICSDRLTSRPHLDHIIPIVLGGRHSIGNCAYSCQHCNQSKSKKLLVEFLYGSR